MQRSGKVAIARFVFRNKEHLAALRPSDGVLTLTTMRFADEVVPPSELEDVLPAEPPKAAKREVEMAEQLIDSLSSEFDPAAYRDEYREELLALIERKAEGKDVLSAPAPEEPKPTGAPDLMSALEESIAAVKGKGEAEAQSGEEAAQGRAEETRLRRQKSQSLEIGRGRRAARSRSTAVS